MGRFVGIHSLVARLYILRLKISAVVILFLISHAVWGRNCPCPEECNACSGGLANITLVYKGKDPVQLEVLDRNNVLIATEVNQGDTIRLAGSLPNSRFRDRTITLILNDTEEVEIDVTCGGFEVYKPAGPFIMIAAESVHGGPICCPSVITYDATGPEFLSLAENIFVDVTGTCETSVDWQNPGATDCNAFTVTSDPLPGAMISVGVTEVVVTATDVMNNSTTTSFTITVRDAAPPVFSYCPEDIEITIRNPLGAEVDWQQPVAIDNCGDPDVESNFTPKHLFSPGVETVTYTARDAAGNKSSCSFTITVNYAPSAKEPLTVDQLKVSQIVTPDGDGVNDFFYISNIGLFHSNKVTIFDRWGNTLAVIENYDNAGNVWRGTGPGSARLPNGTYFYSIVADSQQRRGFIELIN